MCSSQSLDSFLKGTVHSVIADNLRAHGLAGFVESFSGHYICRFCTAQKVDIQSKDIQSSAFLLRNKEIHEAHLKSALETEKNCCGVKRACVLISKKYFSLECLNTLILKFSFYVE